MLTFACAQERGRKANTSPHIDRSLVYETGTDWYDLRRVVTGTQSEVVYVVQWRYSYICACTS